MPATIPKNYYFKQTAEGVLAIEGDMPYEGAVTITWRPSTDYAGSPAEMVIPQALFSIVALDYVTDVAGTKQKKA